jgi:hypothetical protein
MTMLTRFLIYPNDKTKQFMCVCAARDKRHALKIARQLFRLDRTAFAIPERGRQLGLGI